MEQLLTIPEVAPLVKMSRRALSAAIRAKQFPAIHIGSRIRIPVSVVEQWMQAQITPPGTENVPLNQQRLFTGGRGIPRSLLRFRFLFLSSNTHQLAAE